MGYIERLNEVIIIIMMVVCNSVCMKVNAAYEKRRTGCQRRGSSMIHMRKRHQIRKLCIRNIAIGDNEIHQIKRNTSDKNDESQDCMRGEKGAVTEDAIDITPIRSNVGISLSTRTPLSLSKNRSSRYLAQNPQQHAMVYMPSVFTEWMQRFRPVFNVSLLLCLFLYCLLSLWFTKPISSILCFSSRNIAL